MWVRSSTNLVIDRRRPSLSKADEHAWRRCLNLLALRKHVLKFLTVLGDARMSTPNSHLHSHSRAPRGMSSSFPPNRMTVREVRGFFLGECFWAAAIFSAKVTLRMSEGDNLLALPAVSVDTVHSKATASMQYLGLAGGTPAILLKMTGPATTAAESTSSSHRLLRFWYLTTQSSFTFQIPWGTQARF